MFAATAPEVDHEEDTDTVEWMLPVAPLAIKDAEGQPPASSTAEGQPSASSTATGSASSWLAAGKAASAPAETASSECTPQFYDVILFDYIHEMMAGDSKKLSKLASQMWNSINSEDNALSLN